MTHAVERCVGIIRARAPGFSPRDLGQRAAFADMGQTVADI